MAAQANRCILSTLASDGPGERIRDDRRHEACSRIVEEDMIRNRRQTGRSHRAKCTSTMARTAQAGSPPRQSSRQPLHDDHMHSGSRGGAIPRVRISRQVPSCRSIPPAPEVVSRFRDQISLHPLPLLRNHLRQQDGQQSGRGLA